MDLIDIVAGRPCIDGKPDLDKIAITSFVAGCSVGSLGLPDRHSRSDRDLLHPNTRFHIAMTAKRTPQEVISAARTLRQDGFEPVPEIAAQRFDCASRLNDFLTRLRGEADVREIAIIGDDFCDPKTPPACALNLLKTGGFDEYGIRRIGVTAGLDAECLREPARLSETVTRYNSWARFSDVRLHFITRPGLDAESIIAWEKVARGVGNLLPIHAGLVGPAVPGPLPNLERLCGITPSRHADGGICDAPLARVALTAPDGMLAALARCRRNDPDCALHRPHFAVSGGLCGTALWLDAVLRGAFTMRPDGNGFAVRYHATG